MKHSMTRFTSFLLALIMLFSVAVFPVSAANVYTDVPADAWYKGAVDYVTEKEIMNGVTDTTFEPGAVVTRAMFVTVLSRLAKAETDNTVSPFADVPAGQWYTGAVAWAAEHGIVNGVGDNLFAPNNSITRQDMCTVLARFVNAMGYELPQDQTVTFKDIRQVASYARDAVKFCAAAGLVAGYDDGRFVPKGTTIRAEIATVMMRFDMLLDGQIVEPVPMPAQSFDGAAGEDMTVSVNAPEGALPKDTGMALCPVTDEASLEILAAKAKAEVYAAADISFIKDGEELEPEKAVEVQIALDGLENIENPAIVHVNKMGNVEYVSSEMVSTNRAGTEKALRFYAKDFSVYAVIGDGQTGDNARLTVEFYDSDREGAEPAKSYVVTKHDIVELEDHSKTIESAVPDPALSQSQGTMTFCGWTTNRAYTSSDLLNTDGTYKDCSLDAIRQQIITLLESGTVKEGDTYKVYAMYFNNFVVTYLNETGSTIIKSDSIYTKQNEMDYTIYAPYTAENNGYAFRGWTVLGSSASTVLQNYDEVQINTDVSLKAYVRMGKWLTFYEKTNDSDEYKGATYTPPKFIVDSALKTTDKPADPTLSGYTFAGWYVKGTNTPFTFSNRTLDRNYDLEAHWTKNTTAYYTVLFWTQNLDGNGYDFNKSQVVNGATVGNNTSITQLGSGNNTYVRINGEETKYEGFKVKNYETAEIKANNSTVVNVYFDRNSYTLTFKAPTFTRVTSYSNGSTYYYYDSNNNVHKAIYYSSYFYKQVSQDSMVTSGTYYVQLSNNSFSKLTYYNSSYGWYYGDGNFIDSDTAVFTRVSSSGLTVYNASSSLTTVKTINALYGQPIGSYFPIEGDNGYKFNHGERWEPKNSSVWSLVMVYIDTMPAENVTFELSIAERPTKTMNYYVEALPTDTNTVTIGTTKYVLYTSEPIKAAYNGVSAEDFVELTGFTKDRVTNASGSTLTLFHPSSLSGSDQYYEWDTANNATINFLYTRNTYKIVYQDGMYYSHSTDDNTGGQQVLGRDKVEYRTYIDEEGGILYQSDISSYHSGGDNYFTPTLTGFDFQGWYLDSACQTAATTTSLAKMPLGGVQLYAKWQQRAIRVVLELNGGTVPSSQHTNFKIAEYEVISGGQEIKPTRDGYEFIGWYQEPGFVTPYNFATQLFYDENDDNSTAEEYLDSERPTYGDATRPFVVGIRKIYAKWRKNLPGANGLTVVYKADDTDNPSTGSGTFPSDYDAGSEGKISTDKKPYQDGAEAIGRAASDPETGKRFLYWEYKDHNGNTVKVYPGKPFTLDAADAVHVGPNSTPNQPQRSGMPASNTVRTVSGGFRPMTAETTTLASWDFENNSLTGWTLYDSDGDGYNWSIVTNPSDGTVSHGGDYYLRSASYIKNVGALTPNNWIATPGIALPSSGTNTISFYAKSVDGSYPDKLEVYLTTNVSSASNITSNGIVLRANADLPTSYEEFTYTIPASYAGQTVYIAFHHYGVTDQFATAVDDVSVVNTPADAAGEGDEVIWVPVDTIDTTKDYLIGYIDDNGDTWLIMNYNPDTSSFYGSVTYNDTYSNYMAYAVKAIKNSEGQVTGVDTSSIVNATIDDTVWNFKTSGSYYQIVSKANTSKYLTIYNDTTGTNGDYRLSLMPWDYNSSYSSLYLFTWADKYLTVAGKQILYFSSVEKFGAYSGGGSQLQLYSKEVIHHVTKYTVRFYGWNGALLADYTQEIEEFGAAEAPPVSALGMPATGYNFTGWEPDGFDYVTEDMDVYAQFETAAGTSVYTVTFVDKDYNVLSTQTVEEGQDATAPTPPAPETGYHFVGWDVDYTNVHSDLVVAPIYEKNVTDTYTITLHAVYAPIEPEKKTHVTWYPNNGTDDYDDVTDIKMNTGFDIDTPELFKTHTGKDLVQEGYTFLGWARLPERPEHLNYAPENLRNESMYETYEVTEDGKTVTKIKEYHGLTEDNLWLVYNPADAETNTPAHFTIKNETGMTDGTTVTQIAPNEKMPYHGLYAVWKRDVFYVYHSSSGILQAFEVPISTASSGSMIGTFDITKLVPDGYLYGGYYSTYGGVNMPALEEAAAGFTAAGSNGWTAATLVSPNWTEAAELNTASMSGINFVAYTGTSMYTDSDNTNRFWTKADAYNVDNLPTGMTAADVNGETMKPVADTIYYLKEVPDIYLHSYYAFVLKVTPAGTQPDPGSENTLSVDAVYLLSVVDDRNYKTTGVRTGDDYAAAAASTNAIIDRTAIAGSFTLVQEGANGGEPIKDTKTAADLCGRRGYISVNRLSDVTARSFTMLPSWKTLDGVTVGSTAPLDVTIGKKNVTSDDTEIPEAEKENKLYIDVSGAEKDGAGIDWEAGSAATWLYCFGSDDGTDDFIKMTRIGSSSIYEVEVPEKYTKVIILRTVPNYEANWGWDYTENNLYNRGGDINLSSEYNCIIHFWMAAGNAGGWDDNTHVEWKTYIP